MIPSVGPAGSAGRLPKKQSDTPWPKTLPEQARAIRQALAQQTSPASAADIAKQFKGARSKTVDELLATLVSLGHAREVGAAHYLAA